jgi:5'-nucleotidase/UDP-sugar diphosphatase
MKPVVPQGKKGFAVMLRKTHSRREVLVGSAATGAMVVLHGKPVAAADGKKIFTILHTNDIHSNFVGMSPEANYTPFSLNDDKTRGGLARIATLIAARKAARETQGPVLILDDGDYSNGTAFGAATRETGSELQLLFRMGFDATTFDNHEFDFTPTGWGLPLR